MKNIILIQKHQTAKPQVNSEENQITVPVVMMVEGVHNGSIGQVLHKEEYYSQSVEDWNDVPVVIGHPQDAEGNYISAESEGVIQVGRITNAKIEDGKLKAIAVLEENKLIAASPEAHTYIKENRQLDVSIGAYTKELQEAGEYEGEQFEKITTHYQPDHLALLPGEEGACGWADGCGVRVNKKSVKPKPKNNEMIKKLKTNELIESGLIKTDLQVNEAGMMELMNKITNKVFAMDSEAAHYYVEEVYSDYVIYRKMERTGNEQGTKYYKQTYQVSEDEVEFTGEPERVQKKVEYPAITTNQKRRRQDKSDNLNINEKEKEMVKKELIKNLIAHPLSNFSKEDEENLMAQSECFLKKAMPKEPQANKEVTKDDVKKELSSYKQEEIIELMPEEAKDSVKKGLELYAEKRTAMIKDIQANTEKDTWSEDELNDMDVQMLEKIQKSVAKNKSSNYAGAGDPPSVNTESDDEEEPMAVNTAIEEDKKENK